MQTGVGTHVFIRVPAAALENILHCENTFVSIRNDLMYQLPGTHLLFVSVLA